MVCCVREGAADILKTRKDDGYWCSLAGRCLMDSETKFRKFFRVWRDIFHLILGEIKADIRKLKNKIQKTSTDTCFCTLQSQDSCVSRGSQAPDAARRSGTCGVSLRDTRAPDLKTSHYQRYNFTTASLVTLTQVSLRGS
jgi:hypothetical protein